MQRTHLRRTFWQLASVAVTLALLAACNRNTDVPTKAAADGAPSSTDLGVIEKPAGQPRFGGQLTVGVLAESDSYVPYGAPWSVPTYLVGNAFFDPLAAMDDKGIAHPYLAQEMVPNESFTEWTIKLRPNVTFHNGEVLDANAVKLNLDTSRKSGLLAQALTAVKAVDVVDPLTVSVKMSRAWSTYPAALSVQPGYMAAPAMINDPAGAAAKPIGTGPFVFQDRQRDSQVTTKRFDGYWQKTPDGKTLPYLDAITFKIISDNSARTAAMAAGDIDGHAITSPDALLNTLKSAQEGQLQLVTDQGLETDETVIGFNTTKPPFDDPIARQALAYGIDQQDLASGVFQGLMPGAWGMFEASSPYYMSRKEAGYPERDLNKAKALVQQYEQAHGKPLEFSTLIPPDPNYLKIAQTFQAQAAEFGAKVNVESVEQAQLAQRVVATGNYEAAWFVVWSSPSPDRSYVFLATPANKTGLSLNFPRFDDLAITDALDSFRASGSPDERIAEIRKVQQSLAKNLQVLFVVHNHAGFAFRNEVHGVRSTYFDGTQRTAYAPYIVTPFYANVWRDAPK